MYNVTIAVDNSRRHEWLDWMLEKHISDVMRTGCFESYTFSKVLSDDPGVSTYATQYLASSWEDYERYKNEWSAELQKKHREAFGDCAHAFRTLLEIIDKNN